MNSTFPNVMDCPRCGRDEFNDEDDWFEHVSCCQWEQDDLEGEDDGERGSHD